ncbi:hypothetical protein C8F04DRAFT_1238949 [Mycena alexandri]|uniref:Uncharacterized protein n=1 Tax=Mycena alexandri TaxID=1745969 RepID=A0AAD6SDX8_9AGAR|nr:hypothetical protein C8F04DRAFT_1238949 [Mycena alexandri]
MCQEPVGEPRPNAPQSLQHSDGAVDVSQALVKLVQAVFKDQLSRTGRVDELAKIEKNPIWAIADIDPRTAQPLYRLQSFIEHLDATIGEDGNPVIPADVLVDVFRFFAEQYGGMELWAADEVAMLEQLIASNPGMQVTPQVALAVRPSATTTATGLEREWKQFERGVAEERGEHSGGDHSSKQERLGGDASESEQAALQGGRRRWASGCYSVQLTDQLGQEASASPPQERRGESERFRGGYFASLLFAWNWAGRWEAVLSAVPVPPSPFLSFGYNTPASLALSSGV